jgi:predicted RNA binding protein YcfA (HicA-like mRNA interferase family)
MVTLPRVTARQLVRALRRTGWVQQRQAGSHLQLRHDARPGIVTVPMHGGTLDTGLVSNILKQAGIAADELRRLM